MRSAMVAATIRHFSISLGVKMEALEKLENKIVQAVETIELLRMERQELVEEVEALKNEKERLSQQQNEWEAKITSMLEQLTTNTDVTEVS
ncbi:cell division protein ZapB [Marinibactrum halimedae]|nr:cell division protein ZapB [Marinibactrum halimedae]MCD9459921.1 cell division protein ZapB [Marinibactrum halimedae]